jgi:hypothetical protein
MPAQFMRVCRQPALTNGLRAKGGYDLQDTREGRMMLCNASTVVAVWHRGVSGGIAVLPFKIPTENSASTTDGDHTNAGLPDNVVPC